jgi:hypothetical protein
LAAYNRVLALLDESFEGAGGVLTPVSCRLELFVDLLPLDDLDGVGGVLEELGERGTQEFVSLVLDGLSPRTDPRGASRTCESSRIFVYRDVPIIRDERVTS